MKVYSRSSYACSLVSQGKHRFYSLTMPSDLLARTCFVIPRDESPLEGFQRVLDYKRAQAIADYIDNDFGVIPNSVILSAQERAQLVYDSKKKTLSFFDMPRAFLIIDGQHRVYGFSLARTYLRVPVIIFEGLSRSREARLFIDINTKQKPVPNELLLDIKQLALTESLQEEYIRQLFDKFNSEPDSCLLGLLSPTSKSKNKISRVTFTAAIKPIYGTIYETNVNIVYNIINVYLIAIIKLFEAIVPEETIIANPILFRAIIELFPMASRRVNDRYREYTLSSFLNALEPLSAMKKSTLTRPGKSKKAVADQLISLMNKEQLELY